MEYRTWWDEWLLLTRSKRLGFSFCRYLFKRKHVCCLITAWHLTVFSDQSDEFFLFFYVGRLEEQQQGKNIQYCHFPQAFQRQSLATAINIRYECCAHFFSLSFVFIFLFFFFGLTQSAETSSLPSELNSRKKSLSSVKSVNHLTLLQRCHIVNLLLSTSLAVLRISSAGCTEALCFFPLGHCRYIFLYSFRMCSTVNYQLYVILEEKRRARGKQQSHQSLWLHNSCQPYSNKIYHIVNHQEVNVHVCVYICVCVQEYW